MQSIERKMTEKEESGLTEDGIPGVDLKKRTKEELFKMELIKHEQEATIKGLPFASQVALDDREEYQNKVKQTIKRTGYLPKNFPEFKIDWNKYSNLKNFELVNEKERPDTNLSNKNPGLNVTSKTKCYKFIGYDNRYNVMEDPASSIRRAVVNRAKLDKEVSKDIK